MKKYRKMMTVLMAVAATAFGAMATPVYTIFHALEEGSMEVFTAGGQGLLSVAKDGENYETISSFSFDRYGRGVALVWPLNFVPADTPVKLEASFNESGNGHPEDTIVETSAGEFLFNLMRYRRWSWLTYSPVYVSYEELPTIAQIASDDGRFSILLAAVEEAGLTSALTNEGDLTVFAPTDTAFSNLLSSLSIEAGDLLADPDLASVLLYHIVGASLTGDEVAAEKYIETLVGSDVDVTIESGALFINDAEVIIPKIKASNGIIHVTDAVLLPPTENIVEIAAGDDRFETLVAALQETGLDDALTNAGPFTVFAPTDDAFAKLPVSAEELLADPELANILLYHVVDGSLNPEEVAAVERITTKLGKDVKVNVTAEGIFINDAKIIIENIKASNGIIHVIDTVLVPTDMPNIVEIAVGDGNFKTLVGLLQATGLDEVLEGAGPYTVFAPTDEAFAALPGWLVNFLVNNPPYLKQVLLYHVVPGDLDAEEVVSQGTLTTATGWSVKAREVNGEVYIKKSLVIAPNIEAENGIIHVIDRVLIPWF
jgi:transforming growth factor-beta-induced protein